MEQYDNHMKKILPNPNLLPFRVNVVLLKADSQERVDLPANLFQVRPFETIDNLIIQIKEFYSDKQKNPM